MLIALHKNARTRRAMQAEIAASSETASAFAQSYGITAQMVCKGKKRDVSGNRSPRPTAPHWSPSWSRSCDQAMPPMPRSFWTASSVWPCP